MTKTSTPTPAPPALRWGQWVLDEDELFLDLYIEGVRVSGIDLTDIHSSAQVLFWTLTFREEPWSTPEIIDDLFAALVELLDPLETLCPLAMSRTIQNPVVAVRHAVFNRRVADAQRPYLAVRVPVEGEISVYPIVSTGTRADLLEGLDRPGLADDVVKAVAASLDELREPIEPEDNTVVFPRRVA